MKFDYVEVLPGSDRLEANGKYVGMVEWSAVGVRLFRNGKVLVEERDIDKMERAVIAKFETGELK